MIGKGLESRRGGEGTGDRVGGPEFLGMGASEELHQHREALILVAELLARHRPREKEVEMVRLGEGGVVGITPFLRIEVEADDEVGPDLLVHESGAVANLPDAVEEPLGLVLQGE